MAATWKVEIYYYSAWLALKKFSVLSKYTDIFKEGLEQGNDSKWVNVTTGSRFELVNVEDSVRRSYKQQEVNMIL